MITIVYFSLLLFCISTNMLDCMGNFTALAQSSLYTQAQEEPYDSWKWRSIDFNETGNNPILSSPEIVTPAGLDLLQEQKSDGSWEYSTIDDETFSEFEFFDRESSTLLEKSSPSDLFFGRTFTTNRLSYSEQPDTSNSSISSSNVGQYSPSTASEITNDFMDLTQQDPDPDSDTEEFFNFENMVYPFKNINALQRANSLSRQQIGCSQEPSTESLETVPQQPARQNPLIIVLPSSKKTNSPIESDDGYSTVSDQEFDDQEALIPKQPPRKKRKIYQKDVPDNAYFTITCSFCSHKPQLHALRKPDLISNFKRHSKNKHSNITDQETEIYINEHLQKTKLLVKFSVHCPELECKHTLHAHQMSNLKRNLFTHVSRKHPKNKHNYSKKLLTTYLENNYEQTLVPAQEQLKNTKKTVITKQQSTRQSPLVVVLQSPKKRSAPIPSDDEDSAVSDQESDEEETLTSKQPPRKKRKVYQKDVPDNAYFVINCIHCSPRKRFRTLRKSELSRNFENHLKTEHPNIIENQRKIYIREHLQEPEQRLHFSVFCPEPGCKHIARNFRISDLKITLFHHVLKSKNHQNKNKDHLKKFLATYVKQNCVETFVSTQKQSVPDNAYFTLICYHCSLKQQFKTIRKDHLISDFKDHLKKKHTNISEEQAKFYIDKHLQEPEQRLQLSVHCPEPECEHIIHSRQKNDLKKSLFNHVSIKHQKNKDNYSKESLVTHIKNNCKQEFVSAQKQLKNRKKIDASKQQLTTQSPVVIASQSSKKKPVPIPSYDEDSTVFDQKFDEKETLISKRKKRKLDTKDTPDNAYFTLICCHCPRKLQFKSTSENNIIQNFKIHSKNNHPSITEKQTKTYAKTNLQKPELRVKFSVPCPKSECKRILHAQTKGNLKRILLNHISIKHQKNKNNYPKKSIATYVDNDCTKEFVPAQKQLKATKRTRTDRTEQQSTTSVSQQHPESSNLSTNSSSTLRQPSLQTKNMIPSMPLTQNRINTQAQKETDDLSGWERVSVPSDNALNQPIPCFDFDSFKNIDVLQQTNDLSRQQIEERQLILKNLSKKLLEKWLKIDAKELGKTKSLTPFDIKNNTLQPFSKQPPIKKIQLNFPDNAYFTITCIHCSPKKQFRTLFKNNLSRGFENHFKKKHPHVTEKQTKIYIHEHLQEPELFLQFSIGCPKSKCKHIIHNVRRSNLKVDLSNHISLKHPKNKDLYSKKSIATYIENNCKETFIPRQNVSNFVIVCDHCSPKKQFKTSIKSNLINNFKRHSKDKHPSIDDKQTEIYIKNYLQKPDQRAKFSVHCPECKRILRNGEIRKLKLCLFNHLSNNQHPKNKRNHSIKSVGTYIDNNCTKAFVPTQKQSSSKQPPRKKRRLRAKIQQLTTENG